MSDEYEQYAATQPNIASLSHKRILWMMIIVAVAGGIAGFVFVSGRFGAGVMFGGMLSLINYYWLKKSLAKVFSVTADGVKPRFLAVKYFARYATLAAILIFVSLTKIVPVAAVIAGLASFALAVVIEGLIRILTSFSKT